MKIIIKHIFNFALILLTMQGCSKFLDKKPDKKLVIPSKIADLQAILDANTYMNHSNLWLGEASADDYYLTTDVWKSLYSEYSRTAYIWGDELFGDNSNNTWAATYHTVYDCNVVLDNIDKVKVEANQQAELKNAHGIALFFRGFTFHRLATIFANSYDEKTENQDLGIPLRLNSDFNQKSVRSSVGQTYAQIIKDLTQAAQLLPNYQEYTFRPSKCAAYGMLARVYLSMRKYDKALLYADSCLQLNNTLLNFNDLDSNTAYPIPQFNDETILYADGGDEPVVNFMASIDSNLYQLYTVNDLRKPIYFETNSDGSHAMYGFYSGSALMFYGLAVDEQYLIKAECLARSNKISEAMATLNKLLITRWKAGTFIPFTANNSQDALSLILKERRKELLMRDLRWQDIKRLNKEGANISIKRIIDDQTYVLQANSPKFALPLPEYIIKMTGMPQNPR